MTPPFFLYQIKIQLNHSQKCCLLSHLLMKLWSNQILPDQDKHWLKVCWNLSVMSDGNSRRYFSCINIFSKRRIKQDIKRNPFPHQTGQLLKATCFCSQYCKQYGPNSDSSLSSSLIRVHRFAFCLFVLMFYILVNNFSFMSGHFLDWTRTKQRIKCLAQGHNRVPLAGFVLPLAIVAICY